VLLTASLSAAGFSIVAVVRLAVRVAVVESQLSGFNDWLKKVEAKLDRVIEGASHKVFES
jgi:hypothetical protein